MSRDYDRDDRDDRDDDRPRRRDRDDGPDAKKRVSVPAIMLIISAVIGLLLVIANLVMAVATPTLVVDLNQQMIDSMPAGAQKDMQQKQFDLQKDEMRLDKPLTYAQLAVAGILNVLTLVGGMKMRRLSGYGLCVAGAIAAIVPLSGCCLLTTPIGIWALVVLLNPVVKAGFGVRKADPEDDYDRRDRDDDRRD